MCEEGNTDCTICLKDLETHKVGDCIIKCISTPGVTKDAVCFTITHDIELDVGNQQGPFIFTGDTFSQAGIGNPMTGAEQQLFDTMMRLKDDQLLGAEHLLMPGQEAGDANMKFARFCEPHSYNLGEKMKQIDGIVSNKELTIGSKLGEELLFNPFMRCTYLGEGISLKHSEYYKKFTDLPDD